MQLLLFVHVVLLTLSLITTVAMVILHLFSHAVPPKLIVLNVIGTLIGLGAGGILLLSKPLDSHCVLLFGYLLIFSAVQAFLYKKYSPNDLGVEV